MSPKPFHLAWFTPFRTPNWYNPWSERDGREWMNGKYYADQARRLESACFDYMMFEDSLMVSDAYGKSMATDLKYGLYAPKHDPAVQLHPWSDGNNLRRCRPVTCKSRGSPSPHVSCEHHSRYRRYCGLCSRAGGRQLLRLSVRSAVIASGEAARQSRGTAWMSVVLPWIASSLRASQ